MSGKSKDIFLDTHVVIWLYAGKAELFSDSLKYKMNQHDLLISPMVFLELQYLYEIKKINVQSKKIFEDLERKINLQLSETPFSKIIQQSIQETWTRDPFDRLIVSEAKIEQHKLISKDQTILKNYMHAMWE